MTWTLSISCLSSIVDYEENLFERFDRNALRGAGYQGFRAGWHATLRTTTVGYVGAAVGLRHALEHPEFFRCWRHSKGIRDRLRHRATKVHRGIKTVTNRLDI
jgi:hypothetical protein